MNKMTVKESQTILDYYSKYLKGINGYDEPSDSAFIACAIDNLLDKVNNFSTDTSKSYKLKIYSDYDNSDLKINNVSDSSYIKFVNDVNDSFSITIDGDQK